MSYSLRFELQGLPAMGMNARRHWRTIHRENQAWLVRVKMATLGKLPERPLGKAVLTLIRYSSVAPDWDNLVTSFKPIVDALAILDVIEDDSMAVIGQPTVAWVPTPKNKGSIRVEVVEPEPPHSTNCTRGEDHDDE